ncbi:hypothetical protein AB0O28_18880 [Microbispora sp. NPDC088329]
MAATPYGVLWPGFLVETDPDMPDNVIEMRSGDQVVRLTIDAPEPEE